MGNGGVKKGNLPSSERKEKGVIVQGKEEGSPLPGKKKKRGNLDAA